jgi:hypothetical protein
MLLLVLVPIVQNALTAEAFTLELVLATFVKTVFKEDVFPMNVELLVLNKAPVVVLVFVLEVMLVPVLFVVVAEGVRSELLVFVTSVEFVLAVGTDNGWVVDELMMVLVLDKVVVTLLKVEEFEVAVQFVVLFEVVVATLLFTVEVVEVTVLVVLVLLLVFVTIVETTLKVEAFEVAVKFVVLFEVEVVTLLFVVEVVKVTVLVVLVLLLVL